MIFFWCVSSLRMTLARPTSEPVPAVVGTATTGAMPAGSARVHQSPTSSKSHSGRLCPDMAAGAVGSQARLDVAAGGIPPDAAEQRRVLQRRHRALDHRAVDQAFV